MAYGVKYRTILYPVGSTSPVYVDFLKNGYVGAVTALKAEKGGVIINVEDTDYFDPIISTSVEVNIVNTLTDFLENLHDWDDLFAVNDFEILVKVYDSTYTYFEGYIPCDITEQKFYPKGTVTINATVNLKRLQSYDPTMFTTRGQYVLIDIIKHCLGKTGLTLPIYVNCSLFGYIPYLGNPMDSVYVPTYDYMTVARTAFDWVSVESDIFRKNDIEYENCYYILQNILTTFNCKLYYWNGAWYIERVKDLYHPTIHYVVYQTNNTITTVNSPKTYKPSILRYIDLEIGNDRTKLTHVDLSQTVQYTPGVKKILINLKEKYKYNLVNYFFTAITNVLRSSNYTVENYIPSLLVWSYIRDGSFDNVGISVTNYYDILNGLSMTENNPTAHYSHLVKDYAYINAWRNVCLGLYTKFNFNTNVAKGTSLNVKVKFRLSDAMIADHSAEILANPTRKYFVNIIVKNNTKYVKYDTNTNKYILETRGDTASSNILTSDGSTIDPVIISQSIAFDNFTNKENYSTEVSFSIPIDDFMADLIGRSFNIGIGRITTYMNQYGGAEDYNVYLHDGVLGDIIVTTNEDPPENTITGSVNANFIDTKTFDLLFYDVGLYGDYFKENILNQLYGIGRYGWLDGFYVPEPWHYDIGVPIQNKIIEDQYEIYQQVRHTIISDYYYNKHVKPLSIIRSWYYQNLFYASGYRWVIDLNRYDSMSIKELNA